MKRKQIRLFGETSRHHLKRKSKYLQVFALLCAAYAPHSWGQEDASNGLQDTPVISNENKQAQIDLDARKVLEKVVPLGNEYQNNIQLLDNRFRIDSDVKKVTLIFFREYGSAPIVLVRPDGSKLYLDNDGVDDSYDWYDTDTYDMIQLSNPMPGPWQAIGEILPQSRVMVIADITLSTDPIPSPVFSGEIIKITAQLNNAGNRIDFNEFRDVVSLSVDFASTNNPNFINFGLGTKSVARFEDNGLGFDEQSGDGVFTGQFDLKISPGEWQPIFTVRTPLFSREQIPDKVVLRENPVSMHYELDMTNNGYHLLHVDVDRDYVDISSVLLDGTIKHPNGDVERFSVTEISDDTRVVEIINAGYGEYKINLSLFANTVSGRDIVLDVPEYAFTHEMPIVEIEQAEQKQESEAEQSTELVVKEETSESSLIMLVLGLNLGLIMIGGGIIFFILDRRKNPDQSLFKRLANKIPKIRKKPKLAEEN
ncbi:TIGR03503 family protein [Agaribacter flavus]|uniref:TIGR03503 family protein n=1 Tax=Agaribacter flavus TaxID=1902781 RepID=A0ABV7FNF3_9ALTE